MAAELITGEMPTGTSNNSTAELWLVNKLVNKKEKWADGVGT